MSLIYNATFDSQTRVLSLLDKAGNVISSCEVPSKDDITKHLTLRAIEDNSSVRLWQSGSAYNKFEVDKGNGWEDYTINTDIHLNAGESCKWRCKSYNQVQSNARYVRFVMTGKIEASGNCNSMLSSNFENITSLSKYQYAFIALFKECKSLTKAPLLPAKTLSDYCCYYMFEGCSSLKEVRIAATKTSSVTALSNWLNGASATGDFYCDPTSKIFSSGISGIPGGWRRLDINDYPN